MRKQTDYNKLIGRIGDEYYWLEYIFNDENGFKGAVGFSLRPITIEEAEQRREDFDEDNELWKMAVSSGNTELSAEDWHKMVLDIDGDDSVFDMSFFSPYGEELIKKLNADIEDEGERYELTEACGCGRHFDIGMKWDELFKPELYKLIEQAEAKEIK